MLLTKIILWIIGYLLFSIICGLFVGSVMKMNKGYPEYDESDKFKKEEDLINEVWGKEKSNL